MDEVMFKCFLSRVYQTRWIRTGEGFHPLGRILPIRSPWCRVMSFFLSTLTLAPRRGVGPAPPMQSPSTCAMIAIW